MTRHALALLLLAAGCGGATPAVPAPAPVPEPGTLAEAEAFYRDQFLPYRLGPPARTLDEMKAQKVALEQMTIATQDRFVALWTAGTFEIELAARVRYGETFGVYADKLADAPTPVFILDLERNHPEDGAVAIYRSEFAKNLVPYYLRAVEHCTEARDLAAKAGHAGRWSTLAQQCIERWRAGAADRR